MSVFKAVIFLLSLVFLVSGESQSKRIKVHVPYKVHVIHKHHLRRIPLPVPVVKQVPIYKTIHVPVIKHVQVPVPVYVQDPPKHFPSHSNGQDHTILDNNHHHLSNYVDDDFLGNSEQWSVKDHPVWSEQVDDHSSHEHFGEADAVYHEVADKHEEFHPVEHHENFDEHKITEDHKIIDDNTYNHHAKEYYLDEAIKSFKHHSKEHHPVGKSLRYHLVESHKKPDSNGWKKIKHYSEPAHDRIDHIHSKISYEPVFHDIHSHNSRISKNSKGLHTKVPHEVPHIQYGSKMFNQYIRNRDHKLYIDIKPEN
ncbi:hypothetical protein DMENIID0001_099090 [Sergentomyia squamirostris]